MFLCEGLTDVEIAINLKRINIIAEGGHLSSLTNR
jgi:hypothetical protein